MTSNIVIQNIAILFIFVILYDLLFRWNKQFLKNRLFLIFTVLCSAVIPFVSLDVFPYSQTVYKVTTLSTTVNYTADISTPVNWISIIYFSGLLIALTFLLYRIFKIYFKISRSEFEKVGKYRITKRQLESFSFFHYIFLAKHVGDIELNHEKIHVDKLHSLDKILIEFLICLMWFNPFVYRIRFYINENQEFEADELTLIKSNVDKIGLATYLLETYKVNILQKNTLINEFHSITKNRITMLSKNSFQPNFMYFLMLPIIAGVFSSFTFKSYPVSTQMDNNAILQDTIPGDIMTQIDTIMHYDSETNKESTTIVHVFEPLDEYLKKINLSGETVEKVDTITMLDYRTFEKTVEYNEITIPIELSGIIETISYEQRIAVIEEYGKSKIRVEK